MSAVAREWAFPQPFGARAVLIAAFMFAVLVFSGARVEADRMVSMTGNAALAAMNLPHGEDTAQSLGAVIGRLVPLQISEREEISRIDNFDPARLPPFAYVEHVSVRVPVLNPDTLQLEERPVSRSYLVRPFGYLAHVAAKMLETCEIAVWGTLIAVLLGMPLALLGAVNVTPFAGVRVLARSLVSLLRSVPELITALFLVIAYGFGPIAGFLALGLHGAGALGRFFADEIEHADPRPQEALMAAGASRLVIWRLAILPQVMPHHIGSTLYVLDRNVRMATVIGLVGAGGIGQELKGRYDLYDYGQVGTILAAIFLVVLLLDHVSGRLRRQFL